MAKPVRESENGVRHATKNRLRPRHQRIVNRESRLNDAAERRPDERVPDQIVE